MRLESFPHPLAKIIATRKSVKKKRRWHGLKSSFLSREARTERASTESKEYKPTVLAM